MKLLSLLEALPASSIKMVHISCEERNIVQICRLSATSSAFTEDIVYVSTISSFCEIGCPDSGSVYVLLDDMEVPSEIQFPKNYIVCNEINTAGEIFTALLSRLSSTHRVMEAELAISRALFDCTSIKDLLDVAASLLGNPVLLQDFTTRLLAYSKWEKMDKEDEILDNLFRVGYVQAELFEKYDYANVLDKIKNTPQTFLLESTQKSDRLICRLNVNRRYFGWFLTVAYNQPFQAEDIEIMNFLSGALSLFLEKENILPNMTRNENLLQELLRGASYTDETFRKRAAGFSWELHGHYYVITITVNDNCMELRTIMAYKNHLSLMFPEAIILEESSRLVLLFDVKNIMVYIEALIPFLEKYDLKAAYSCRFGKITEYPYIYKQTISVLILGCRIHPEQRLFSYRDYAVYCALQDLGEDGYIKFYCMPELINVYRYDKMYGTFFAESKRLVLEMGNIGQVAKKLNVHRNTVEYRLRKFNEISGVWSYTASVIEQLLISYKILDLFPGLVDEIEL